MTSSSTEPARRTLVSSAGRGWTAIDADLVHVPRGLARAPASERHVLGLHFGPPVNADCIVGGVRMADAQKSGDISFIPAGVDGSWEDDADCRILRLVLRPALLAQVADELGTDVFDVEPSGRVRYGTTELIDALRPLLPPR